MLTILKGTFFCAGVATAIQVHGSEEAPQEESGKRARVGHCFRPKGASAAAALCFLATCPTAAQSCEVSDNILVVTNDMLDNGVLSCPGLTSLKRFSAAFVQDLTKLDFPDLQEVTGDGVFSTWDFEIYGNPLLEQADFPSLKSVDVEPTPNAGQRDGMSVDTNNNLSSLEFPALESATILEIKSNSQLATVELPALTRVGGDDAPRGFISVNFNSALRELDLSTLESIDAAEGGIATLEMFGNGALATVDLSGFKPSNATKPNFVINTPPLQPLTTVFCTFADGTSTCNPRSLDAWCNSGGRQGICKQQS